MYTAYNNQTSYKSHPQKQVFDSYKHRIHTLREIQIELIGLQLLKLK